VNQICFPQTNATLQSMFSIIMHSDWDYVNTSVLALCIYINVCVNRWSPVCAGILSLW